MRFTGVTFLALAIFTLGACGEAQEQADNQNEDNNQEEQEAEAEEESVELEFPAASPRSELKQNVGITEVRVDYSRPSVRDREIWGELVPYDEIWRTGANAATTFYFEHDVYINGNHLEAGEYSFLSIPRDDEEWTLIFNESTEVWGTRGYEEDNDALRIDVDPVSIDRHHEMMTFNIHDVDENSGLVSLAWKETEVAFELETETHERVAERIEKAIEHAADDDWETFSQAAGYYIDREENLDQAEEWLNTAMEIEENWRNHYNMAELFEAKGNIERAIEHNERALEIGREEEEFGAEGFLEDNLERLQEHI